MSNTMTVYVSRDDSSPYQVLTTLGLEENFDDMLNDVYGTVSIAGSEYDTARTLRDVDPIAYRVSFSDYSSEWHELEMPMDMWLRDDEDEIDRWVAAELGDELDEEV